MKRLMPVQTTEIAFETEDGARSHPGGKPFLGSEVKTGPTPPLASVDRYLSPEPTVPYERIRWALFLAASLALHAGMLAALQRKAPPLASVGVQSISVEIMRADKLSALAKEPSDSVLTINSAAAQGEHPLSVEPEATYQEIKVAEVASAAVTIRAPATVGIEPTVPGLPGYGQAVATAEIIETKQVEAKVAEPKLTIKSVGTQTDRPDTVRPTSARAAGAPAPIEAEPITPALSQLDQAVAAAKTVETVAQAIQVETKIAQPKTAEVTVFDTMVAPANAVHRDSIHPGQAVTVLPSTPTHSTDTAQLIAPVPSGGTALPSAMAKKSVVATAKSPLVQSTAQVSPVHTAEPRAAIALPPPPASISPAIPTLPLTASYAPSAIPSPPPPSPSALTDVASLPTPTLTSRPPSSLPLLSSPAPSMDPPFEAATTVTAMLTPNAGDAVLTPVVRPVPETIQERNAAGVTIQILPGAELRVGDKISLRVATKKPGYLMIIDIDAGGKVTQIFPNRRSLLVARQGQGTANLIKPGRPVTIPEIGNPYAGFEFVAAPPTGVAAVVAILTDRPMPRLDLPEIPASIVGPAAAVNYLTEWAHNLHFARGGANASPEKASWSFDARLYTIR